MSAVTAPPSNLAKIVNVPFAQRALVEKYSPGGRYIDAESDVDSPWVPFGDNAAIKHLAFDVRTGIFSNILWVKSAGAIGTHLHRGTIMMVCLEGSVRYLEYDWVASPGGLILEVPGESHTLVTEHPQGCNHHGQGIGGHCRVRFLNRGVQAGQRALEDRMHRRGHERRAAGTHARERQQVLDEVLHPAHAADREVDEVHGVGVELVAVASRQQLHVARHGPQRRTCGVACRPQARLNTSWSSCGLAARRAQSTNGGALGALGRVCCEAGGCQCQQGGRQSERSSGLGLGGQHGG